MKLKKFNGEIVTYSGVKKTRSILPKTSVYFHLGGILVFCSFILLSTGYKLIVSNNQTYKLDGII